MLICSRIPLRKFSLDDLDPATTAVREAYINRYGDPPAKPGGWYRDDDWIRISFVLENIRPGGTILDVGIGAGQFVNAVAVSERFDSVVGVDTVAFEKYFTIRPIIERRNHSIENLPFADDSFDVVTCMEVLEHVPETIFDRGLAELRRVCRGQLIMTVPFEEPEPISRFHLRRFESADIVRIFPNSNRILLDRPRMPWILLEEWPGDPHGSSNRTNLRLSAVEAYIRLAGLNHADHQIFTRLQKELETAHGEMDRLRNSVRYRMGTILSTIAYRPWRICGLHRDILNCLSEWRSRTNRSSETNRQ